MIIKMNIAQHRWMTMTKVLIPHFQIMASKVLEFKTLTEREEKVGKDSATK